ncbi:mitochondrial carrier protein [Purpureocillium lavendulum]|uniref:Mitochondrial carrier protein n=1 Tax=Purpureocillium lavendulum TaxID=1247861 RepID=A0AB34FF41_9HYPO|nr:mitochondrial carrier protein [Purpureocillium lavendulum]
MPGPCYIVPPHLLRGIAESEHNSEATRRRARVSLATREHFAKSRFERLIALSQASPGGVSRPCPIIPEVLLSRLSVSEHVDEAARSRAKRDLDHLQTLSAKKPEGGEDRSKNAPYRAVYDAEHAEGERGLPGKLVRAEGQDKVKDHAVNEAYDNVGHVLDFYLKKFHWKSIDNKNAKVISSVHFGESYENAFWDHEKFQMVFGDGGEYIGKFTGCIDVIGHEITHAVTEHTSPLDYQGQPGALNEHVSDVFGIMIKQKLEDEKAHDADWLVGEGCLLPGVKGQALRSMKSPGKAYDDPRFGKDPQVDNMDKYDDTYEDNGGVHIYSGIPNKAFYLAAVAFGGFSWEKAGQIWWKTMNSGRVASRCTFEQFADVTIDVAKEEFGEEAAKTVRKAWDEVGVTGSA